tara:strand:- start:324 stop:554 length:231 start_codon:yes stop_codon:yes gene_type:complete
MKLGICKKNHYGIEPFANAHFVKMPDKDTIDVGIDIEIVRHNWLPYQDQQCFEHSMGAFNNLPKWVILGFDGGQNN